MERPAGDVVEDEVVEADVDRTATETGRDGATISTAYDAAGNPTRIADSASGSVVQATWYLDGRERTVDDGTSAVRAAHDGSGSLSVRVDVTGAGTITRPTAYRHGNPG